jgi:hypothetical protein
MSKTPAHLSTRLSPVPAKLDVNKPTMSSMTKFVIVLIQRVLFFLLELGAAESKVKTMIMTTAITTTAAK